MMEYQLAGQEVIIVAVAVWFVGTFINNRVPLLKRYSIPVAVTGGVLFSMIVTVLSHKLRDHGVVGAVAS